MSSSPALRRLSNASSNSMVSPAAVDGLVNYYEAEEERIINLLSRKLEKLRVEKINLENALEAESESQVNRLSRELTALRRQQQHQQQSGGTAAGSSNHDEHTDSLSNGFDPRFPSTDIMLDALRRENESLRTRLVQLERDYIRIRRLNEVYREELIDHRTKAGTSTDNLIDVDANLNNDSMGHSAAHRKTPSSGSPNSAVLTLSSKTQRPSAPIPMPRTSSSSTGIYQLQSREQNESGVSSTTSSLTHSPTSFDSPYTFSPPNGTSLNPASYLSNATNFTTPPSSMSLYSNPPLPYPMPPPLLSYPSVPPPSLSSSLGSPTMPFLSGSSTGAPDTLDLNFRHRQNSITRRRGSSSARVAETGSLREISESRSRSRRQSIERSGGAAAAAAGGGMLYANSPRTRAFNLDSPETNSSSTSSPIPIRVPSNGSREGTPVNG